MIFEEDIVIPTTLVAGSILNVKLFVQSVAESKDVKFCVKLVPKIVAEEVALISNDHDAAYSDEHPTQAQIPSDDTLYRSPGLGEIICSVDTHSCKDMEVCAEAKTPPSAVLDKSDESSGRKQPNIPRLANDPTIEIDSSQM
jgi:hypothetical protein